MQPRPRACKPYAPRGAEVIDMPGQRARLCLKSSAVAWAVALASVPGIAAAQAPPSGVPSPPSPQPASFAAPPPAPWPVGLAGPLLGQIFPPYRPTVVTPVPYTPPASTPYGGSPPPSRHDVLSNEAHSWPILRASNGVGVHVVPGAPMAISYDFDAAAGYRWAFHRRAFLVFEGGYSYSNEPTYGGHFGTIGAGPEVYLHRFVGLGWTPKFVIGETSQGLALGVRNTLNVPILMRVFNVEIGHQYLRVGGGDQHEVRGQIGVDLAATLHLVLWLLVKPGY